MNFPILKGFLPWLAFFSFADGTALGTFLGYLSGLFLLFIFNRGAFRKGAWLDWAALVFFVMMWASVRFNWTMVYQHGFLWANLVISLLCFLSVVFQKSITQPYAELRIDESYWKLPLFQHMHRMLTVICGLLFLASAIVIGLYDFAHVGSVLWMHKIVPTFFLIVIVVNIFIFPDRYRIKQSRKLGGVANIPGISDPEFSLCDSILIGFRRLGKGAPVLLLQDAALNCHAWDVDFLKRLAQSYELILVDCPGVGYSRTMPAIYTPEMLAGSLRILVEQLKLDLKAVIGFGMGGMVAQSFSEANPKTFSLVLINTDLGGEQAVRAERAVLERWCQRLQSSMEEKLKAFFPVEVLGRLEKKVRDLWTSSQLEGDALKELSADYEKWLARWYDPSKKPTMSSRHVLWIVGKQDQLIPSTNQQFLKNHFKHARVVEYPDAGHGVIYQYPFDIVDQITQFLG